MRGEEYKSKALTLIELLIVIAVIAILVAAIVYLMDPGAQMAKARDAQRKADLNLMQKAINSYELEKVRYPDISGSGNSWNTFDNIASVRSALVPSYARMILKDPKNGSSCPGYLYYVSADFKNYAIFAKLETSTDTDAARLKKLPANKPGGTPATGDSATFTVTSGICAGSIYNYWVSSDD